MKRNMQFFSFMLLYFAASTAVLAGTVFTSNEDETNDSPASGNNVTIEHISAPDGFGYVYADSNEAGGPAYNFIDISATGTDMGLDDDSHYWPIDLPFSFNFYGTDYSQVAVGSNGTVYFEDAYLGLANAPIPGDPDYAVERFIAGYWDDLDPGSSGSVLYEIQGTAPNRRLIVQWEDVPHYDENYTVRYQVILQEGTNSILMQYADPSSEAGSGATVGIQGNPDTGLQYLYNNAALTANLAICFAHPNNPDASCSQQLQQPAGSVPTLSGWGLIALISLMGLIAGLRSRREN